MTARGNERRLIYRDDRDRRRFLETLEEAVQQNGLRVHGYCLMPNHYHLLVETPRGNLCRSIGWLQTTYSIRFNRRHRRSGHLFQGRFKAHLVEADSHAMELLRYVHLNPVRLGAERRIDVARAVGYKDGSAITHQIKRLEADVATQPVVATRMAHLRRTFAKTLSSFKS